MLSIDEIHKILPHRYPFLMVDGVTEVGPERILAFKNVSANEPHFAGHFPELPVMPGVLVIEALAQAGAILAQQQGAFDPETQLMYFVGIDRAKFRRRVRPGDRLDLEVLPLRTGTSIWRLKGTARVGGQVAASAELTASIQARS
jgi:beta-hydroxyacyl-ACP dehydratase FabZ